LWPLNADRCHRVVPTHIHHEYGTPAVDIQIPENAAEGIPKYFYQPGHRTQRLQFWIDWLRSWTRDVRFRGTTRRTPLLVSILREPRWKVRILGTIVILICLARLLEAEPAPVARTELASLRGGDLKPPRGFLAESRSEYQGSHRSFRPSRSCPYSVSG
jgi:hypothetical protein